MGNKTIVQHFIKHGVRLDIANQNGDTALHMAAYHFHDSVVELLVTAEAPLNVANKVFTWFSLILYYSSTLSVFLFE